MALSKITPESINLASDFAGMGFGGTGAANQLDDYEEGAWTPTLIGTSGNPSGTASVNNAGFYTKVGRQILVNFRVEYTSVSGGSGIFGIGGLPFSVIDDNTYRASGNVSFFRGVTHGGSRLAPHARTGDSDFIFYAEANSTEFDSSVNASGLSSSVSIHGFFIYVED